MENFKTFISTNSYIAYMKLFHISTLQKSHQKIKVVVFNLMTHIFKQKMAHIFNQNMLTNKTKEVTFSK